MQVIINRIVFIVMVLAVFFMALYALISLMDFDNHDKFDVGYLCGVISIFFVIVLKEMVKRGMI